MKKILIALTLMAGLANAQTVFQKPVLCADLKEIIKTVTGPEHKEKTGWTIVEYRNEWGCIIGASEKSELATNVKIE
ncbi:MAG: hypothetical protein EBV10_10240 [Synechococcaceae bacterium WB6_1A_059]|nr:hypothetical protein [Synechococcaceae bacterium WB6_1A_059]